MRSLAQALRRTSEMGLRLPALVPGITPRRGQVLMLAGPPNGGKSMLALHYLIQAKVPALMFSADTDAYTQLVRASAMLTGALMDDIERELETEEGVEEYTALLAERVPFLKFCFEPSPTLDDIDLEIRAYEEVMGTPPEIIAVDNLMNVQGEHDDEWGGLREISKALHHIGRSTGAGILALHHVSEANGSPVRPAKRKDIQGKIGQLPEVILTVAMGDGQLRVACVKNRSGPHDPNAETYQTLYTDPSRMQIYPTQQAAWAAKQRSTYS